MIRFRSFFLALLLFACSGITAAAEIIVSAAASLTNVFKEIGREFEKLNPGQKVTFNFAGSGQLLQQIARGAPVDVFASADQDTMDRAAAQNLIVQTSRVDFTANVLVLAAARDWRSTASSLAALRDPSIRRIAISNVETVPVGKYSKEALEAVGLFETLRDKYINTQNVRQSLDYVARGEVDVAFVYATDVTIMPDRVKVLFEVPTRTPITYPVAVVKDSRRKDLAFAFVAFIRSETAQRILSRYGFRPVN